jgi:alkylation response protein AidB-like acyl-CoA dehydrogenase
VFELTHTPEEEAFRAELRAWLASHLPSGPVPEDEEARRRFQRTWQHELAAAGFVGIQWPREYGGRAAGLSP